MGAIAPALLWFGGCAAGPVPFDEIRSLEAARSGAERLEVLSTDDDPDVRKAACDALGTLGGPVGALGERLDDDRPAVRYAAAFALGRLPGAAVADLLLPQLEAEDPNLRLLAARGLGRPGADVEALLDVLEGDAEPAVRSAAAISIGLALDGRDDADGPVPEVERQLGRRLAAETDPNVRWRICWALSRFDAGSATPDLLGALRDATGTPQDEPLAAPTRWIRVMALRALGRRAGSDDGIRTELAAMLRHRDPQVSLAAMRGLEAALPDGEPAPKRLLRELFIGLEFEERPARVIRQAIEIVDAHPGEGSMAFLTEAGWVDAGPASREIPALVDHPEVAVRTAALEAAAHHAPDRVVARCAERIGADDPLDRMSATAAARWLAPDTAEPILARALDDADVRVRTAAVKALAGHPDAAWLDALLERAAGERDLAMREKLGATLEALAPGRGGLARQAFEDSPGAAFAEARKVLLAAVVACAPEADDLDGWLRERLDDPFLGVRRAGARALAARGAEVPPYDDTDAGPFPRLGAEVPPDLLATRPVVEVQTTRGTIELTLMPIAAPVHVWNFLQLARSGAYDGTVFHRVVPDFVLQGGSRRGDGYDNTSWLGGRLRDEISPLPFLEGTVGMPKTVDPDTGGGQFFVTLTPAPHLDGRYTAFGRVTRGLDVAESIEVGDEIVHIVAKSP